jgi:hypothetical protein
MVMKINRKTGVMEKIKYNNHEMERVEGFRYLRSKLVTNRSVKDEITEIIYS